MAKDPGPSLSTPGEKAVTSLSLPPPRFPELESPGLSKVLRTAAFAYPFLFDNLPLFYRVREPDAPALPAPQALAPQGPPHQLCLFSASWDCAGTGALPAGRRH